MNLKYCTKQIDTGEESVEIGFEIMKSFGSVIHLALQRYNLFGCSSLVGKADSTVIPL
jgi:hypothetical protein